MGGPEGVAYREEEEADAGAEGHGGRKKMWLVATGHVIERPKHNILSKLQVS
jgi:hypothetical protein